MKLRVIKGVDSYIFTVNDDAYQKYKEVFDHFGVDQRSKFKNWVEFSYFIDKFAFHIHPDLEPSIEPLPGEKNAFKVGLFADAGIGNHGIFRYEMGEVRLGL